MGAAAPEAQAPGRTLRRVAVTNQAPELPSERAPQPQRPSLIWLSASPTLWDALRAPVCLPTSAATQDGGRAAGAARAIGARAGRSLKRAQACVCGVAGGTSNLPKGRRGAAQNT